jgi:hypothetical protein
MFVEEADNLFDNFNGGTSVNLEKTFSDDSPHNMSLDQSKHGVSCWVLFKDGKFVFL